MKNIIQKHLKISVTLFIILLMLINCKQDEFVNNSSTSNSNNKITTKNVSLNEIPMVMNFLTNITSKDFKIKIDDTTRNDIIVFNKNNEDNITLTSVETENIIQTINERKKSNYAFKLNIEETESIDDKSVLNLIVKETASGYKSYIIKYEPNEEWFNQQNGILNLEYYKGKVIIYNNQGKYIVHYDIDNGELVNKSDVRNPCDPNLGGGNGHGGGTYNGGNDGIGNGIPIGSNPTVPGGSWAQGGVSGSDGSGSDGGSNPTGPGPNGECCFYYDGEGDKVWFHDHEKLSFRPEILEIIFNPDVDRFLKNGLIDSNGDCIPDSDDDGYEDPDENDIIVINKISDPETPCEDLNNIHENPNRLRTQLNQLKNDESNFEKGIQIRRNPFTNINMPRGNSLISNSGSHYVSITIDRSTVAIAHSHPNGDDFAFYSGTDILNLAKLAMTYNPDNTGNVNDPIIFTAYLVTNGQTYAIKFDDIQSIANLINIYNQGKRAREKFHKNLINEYDKDNRFPNTSDISEQKGRFFDFLEDNNLNISAYKATYNNQGYINGWSKINKDTLTLEPCN